jgi:hypothetical protein
LADTQEPDQGTLGEGLNTLLAAYSDEEEVATSTDPQEPVEKPTQEQAPIEAEDPTQGNEEQEEEASVISPKTTEITPPTQSPKIQEPQMENPEHSGSTEDKGSWKFSLTQQ